MRRTLLAVGIAMLLSMMVILAKISPPKIYLFEERNGSQSYPFSLTHLGMKPPTKLLALLVLHFGMMWHAKAATITYDVGNSNFSFLADSFVNNTFSGIIDVPVGGSKIGTLQSGEFRVEFGPSGSTPFTLTETFNVNGISSTVQLSGTMDITGSVDILTYSNRIPTTERLPGGEVLTVTPLPLQIASGFAGQFGYRLEAKFALVPDLGSTFGLLFLSLTALLGACRLRFSPSA